MNDLTNQILNQRYQLTQKLGQGGLGEVWQATDLMLNRLVAIKLLLPKDPATQQLITWSEEDIARFLAEAKLLANLEHNHILTVYDCGQVVIAEKKSLYLVTELALGGTLADRLQKDTLALTEIEVILGQVCQALDYIHQKKVLHLDLKPHNIIFTNEANPSALLTDFGMAMVLGKDVANNSSYPNGTREYMSPEQFWNDKLTQATDIYTLGIMLHQMLTGKLPKRWPQDPLSLSELLPDKLQNIIYKTSHDEPEQRYQSANEVYVAFAQFLTEQPSVSPRSRLKSPYGTMHPNSEFYIKRKSDERCEELLSQTEANTIVLKGPRKVGRSSLMQRMLHKVPHHRAFVFIDFELLPEVLFDNSESFFLQFCLILSDSLDLPNETERYWKTNQPDTIKCERYLAKHILPKLDKDIILALDQVDKIFNHPVSNDFFAMLRVWHNKRAYQLEFERVSLFLSISTEPNLLIADLSQSPFNVGKQINLEDFKFEDVQRLNELYGQPLVTNQVNELMILLSGHPFFTKLALYELAIHHLDWVTLQQQATRDEGPFNEYLQRYFTAISNDIDLKNALIQLCKQQFSIDNRAFYRLKSAGLVKKENNKVVFRNELYARYFTERLNING